MNLPRSRRRTASSSANFLQNSGNSSAILVAAFSESASMRECSCATTVALRRAVVSRSAISPTCVPVPRTATSRLLINTTTDPLMMMKMSLSEPPCSMTVSSAWISRRVPALTIFSASFRLPFTAVCEQIAVRRFLLPFVPVNLGAILGFSFAGIESLSCDHSPTFRLKRRTLSPHPHSSPGMGEGRGRLRRPGASPLAFGRCRSRGRS